MPRTDPSGPPRPVLDRPLVRRAGLRYVQDDRPGIRRLRTGSGFRYVRVDGRPLRDAEHIARIRSLAIPPAYEEVWICPDPNGHLQASGRDARGRKQYRYHPLWRKLRDDGKFSRLVAFGHALPQLRARVRRDLAMEGPQRDRVLATVVVVLSSTLVRIGNAEYARTNGSFGLTTLGRRHVRFDGNAFRLRFQGKSGQVQDIGIDDRRLVRLLREMHQLPGQRLFQYRDDGGALRAVSSTHVNAYLQDAMGERFTAKDFRTWGGTIAAFRALADIPRELEGQLQEAAAVRGAVVDAVAALLGNTPAVCRGSYIDPCVFEGWEDGRLQRAAGSARGPRQWEQAALRFLSRAHGDAGTRRKKGTR